ncbi:galactosyl transferase gma12 mnn10 family protein [Phlyctema vagabunda]|uniref:Galactosyl transferase gma12 mnn10 family protein n=1 Tax=Phlyctema vagabunda TaxID=108571 RepID=A0ABR4PKS0_9HELO
MKRQLITTKVLFLISFAVGAFYYYILSNQYHLPSEISSSRTNDLPIVIPHRVTEPGRETEPESEPDPELELELELEAELEAELISEDSPFESSGDNRDEVWARALSRPRVGKMHALFGQGRTKANERALEYHLRHSLNMDHPMFVLREEILHNVWTKHAFVQKVITQELERPANQRLEWLMWVDADVVIMNPTISLDIFIPPSPDFDHVNILATNDYGRLNDGVFMMRVNEQTLRFFAMVIGYPSYYPEVKLRFSEQSAMEQVMKLEEWEDSVVLVPQVWFNAYRLHKGTEGHAERLFQPGMLQIHFAGNRDGLRPDRMNKMMDTADQNLPEYNVPAGEGFYQHDISKFWSDLTDEMTKAEEKEDPEKLEAEEPIAEPKSPVTESVVAAKDIATKDARPTGNPTIERLEQTKVDAANSLKNQTRKVAEDAKEQTEGKGWRGKEFEDLSEKAIKANGDARSLDGAETHD